jgi:pimeloyl-ACP methyl ester carboxylesterase
VTVKAPRTQIAVRDVDANGWRFHCREAGGSGEPVLLLHGFPETSRMWEPLMARLADDGYGMDNIADMRRFIDRVTSPDGGDARLVEAVRSSGADLARFRREVAAACGGVWIYLRYVLNEIRDGAGDPRGVGDLPADLAAYYAEQVQFWRGLPDDAPSLCRWEQTRLPLLGALAAAHAPLTVPELAALAGIPADESARSFIEETTRAFLSGGNGSAGAALYMLRHQSLRDLLTGKVPPGRPDLDGLARLLNAHAGRLVEARIGMLSASPKIRQR